METTVIIAKIDRNILRLEKLIQQYYGYESAKEILMLHQLYDKAELVSKQQQALFTSAEIRKKISNLVNIQDLTCHEKHSREYNRITKQIYDLRKKLPRISLVKEKLKKLQELRGLVMHLDMLNEQASSQSRTLKQLLKRVQKTLISELNKLLDEEEELSTEDKTPT